jgi:hypothetical protein
MAEKPLLTFLVIPRLIVSLYKLVGSKKKDGYLKCNPENQDRMELKKFSLLRKKRFI